MEIVTIGVIPPPTLSSLCFTIGGDVTGVEFLRQSYNTSFQVQHTLLVDPAITTPPDLRDNCVNMMAEWFYRKKVHADVYAVIGTSMILISQLNAVFVSA